MADIKTYKPGLLLACKFIRKYIVKWKDKLLVSLTPGQYELLLAVLDAVETLTSALLADEPPVEP